MTDLSKDYTQTAFDFLDELRASGTVNMFGAGSYLEKEFGMPKKLASKIAVSWMENFEEDGTLVTEESFNKLVDSLT